MPSTARLLSRSRSASPRLSAWSAWSAVRPALPASSSAPSRREGLIAIIALVGAVKPSRSSSISDRSPSARWGDRRCGPLWPSGGARAGAHDGGGRVERSAAVAAPCPLQHRRPFARFAGGRGGVLTAPPRRPGRPRPHPDDRRRRSRGFRLLRGQHGLVSFATAVEGHERWSRAFQERFAWLVPHYLVYGFIAGVIFLGYESAHLWAFAVFAVPLS